MKSSGGRIACDCFAAALLFSSIGFASWPAQGNAQESSTGLRIVLPPRIVAGQPATLAALDAQGQLAPGVTLELPDGKRLRTGETGRAYFTAPAQPGALIVKAFGGAPAACLVQDNPLPSKAASTTPSPAAGGAQPVLDVVPEKIAQKGEFVLQGRGFRGAADDNRLRIGEERALVLAASPVSLVVAPGPNTSVGENILVLEANGRNARGQVTVLGLIAEFKSAGLQPGETAPFRIQVLGTDKPVLLRVGSRAQDVAGLKNGNYRQVRTRGGKENIAEVSVKTFRAGEFSLSASFAEIPSRHADADAALQYLKAAQHAAPAALQDRLEKLVEKIEQHPGSARKVRSEVEHVFQAAQDADLRLLLKSALESLPSR